MNSLFGLLCTLCCVGDLILDEETGDLVCTHHEVTSGGSLVSCGHRLRDTQWTRMLLSANALAHKGKLPAFATAPTEQPKVRPVPKKVLGHLSLYVNPSHPAQSRYRKARRSVR